MANQNITNKNVTEPQENIFRYLCPSLLSQNDILKELKTRCFKIKGLEIKSRDELTQIFIKHLLPLPQRCFPNNHHGNLINKMILRENAPSKRKEKHEQNQSCLQYGFNSVQDTKLSLKSPAKGGLDRLKPPIDSSSVQHRKISFSKTSSSSSSTNATLDKIVVNSHLERCHRKSMDEMVETAKNDLKRAHSETEEDISPSKKGRQRIAWP